jgi:hypothetical protein
MARIIGFVHTPHGYRCTEGTLVATANFVWDEIETFAPDGT